MKFLGQLAESEAQQLQAREELIKEGNYAGLLKSAVESIPLVLEKAADNANSFMALFCVLLKQVKAEEVEAIVESATDKLTASTSNSKTRTHILTKLFNLCENPKKYNAYVKILEFSKQAGDGEVIPSFKNLNDWFRLWNCTPPQIRNIYKLAYQIYEHQTNMAMEAYRMLCRYLETYEEGNDFSDSQEASKLAIVHAIQLDDIHDYTDLLSLRAVQDLKNTNSKLYDLLVVFSEEKLDSLESFHQQNPSFLESIGLTECECKDKIRVLAFNSLAASSYELEYATIAKSLKLKEEDVESWVIVAFNAGLVEARIDEIERKIFIQRCTQKLASPDQWNQVGCKVNKWKNDINGILTVLERSHE